MTRPTDWSSLGYSSDPIPGDHSRVDLIGRQYVGTADSILRAAENLRTALAPNFGESESVDAIREVAGDVADRVSRAEDRYRKVGDAMVVYAAALRGAQDESLIALTNGNTAESNARSANSMANYYQGQVDNPNTPPANVASHTDSQTNWQNKADAAERGLATAIGTLQTAIGKRDAAAATAIGSIEKIGNSGDLNDSGWDNIVQWVRENKELIDLIVDIVGYIATAVMIVALFIPGLNVIAGFIALVATIVTLANVALQVAADTMGPVEAILSVALAALTFVGGRAIGSAVKGTQSAARTSVGTSIRNSFAGSGIRGMTQNRALNLVDDVIGGSKINQLGLLDRLKFMQLDLKTVAQIRNVANIELLSGAVSSSSAGHLARLARLGAVGWGIHLGSEGAGLAIGSATANEKPLPWRLGANW